MVHYLISCGLFLERRKNYCTKMKSSSTPNELYVVGRYFRNSDTPNGDSNKKNFTEVWDYAIKPMNNKKIFPSTEYWRTPQVCKWARCWGDNSEGLFAEYCSWFRGPQFLGTQYWGPWLTLHNPVDFPQVTQRSPAIAVQWRFMGDQQECLEHRTSHCDADFAA